MKETKDKARLVDPKSEEGREMERADICHYEVSTSPTQPGRITAALIDCRHLTEDEFARACPSRSDFSLEEMLAEVERETGMRRQVYPKLLASNMKRETADRQIGLMVSLANYLREVIARDGRQPDLFAAPADGKRGGGVYVRGHHER